MSDATARLTALTREVAASPGSARYPELADLLIRLGRYAEAVDVCSRGLAASERPEGRLVRGDGLLLLGRVEEARADVERYLAARPEDARGLRILGECHLRAGRPDHARTPLERSARLDPSDMRTLDLLQQAEAQADAPGAATAAAGAGWADGPVILDAPADTGPVSPWEAEGLEEAEAAPLELDDGSGPAGDDAFALGGGSDPAGDDPFAFGGGSHPAGDDPFALGGSGQAGDDPFALGDSGPAGDDAFALDGDAGAAGGDPRARTAGAGAAGDDPFALDGPASPPRDPLAAEFDLDGPSGPPRDPLADSGSFDLDGPSDPPPEPPAEEAPAGLDLDPDAPLEVDLDRAGAGPQDDPFADLGEPSATGHVPRPRQADLAPAAGRPVHRRLVSADRPPARDAGRRNEREAARDKLMLRLKIGAAVAAVLLLVGAGLGLRAWLRGREVSEHLALAAAAAAKDTAGAYREAERHLQQILEAAPEHPDALGLGAFVTARLFTAFDGGTEMLVTAEDRIAAAERLETMPPAAHAARGLLDLAADRMGDAVLRAEKGLGDAPGHPMLLWVRAQAYRAERPDLARADLESVRRSHPEFLPAVGTLADLLSSDGHRKDAARLLAEVAAAHPEHVPTLTGLLQAAEGGLIPGEEALERLEAVRGALLELAGPSDLCRLHLATARLAVRMDRPDRARQAEETARTVMADADCKRDLGRHLIRRHRLEAGAEQLGQAADASTDAATAAALRLEAARAALRAGRPGRVLELLPEGGRVRESGLRALAQLAEGNADAARTELVPLLSGRRIPAEVWAAAARLEIVAGDPRAARRAVLRARRNAGQREADILAASRLLLDTGDARRASALLEPAVRRASRPSYALLTLSGRALAARGRTDAALERLEAAIRLNPEAEEAVLAYLPLAAAERASAFFDALESPSGPALRALLALHQGAEPAPAERGAGPWAQWVSARLAEREAPSDAPAPLSALVGSEPTRVAPAVALGEAWLRLGRIRKAEEAFQNALRRDPTSLAARIGLAETQVRGGAADPAEAVAAVERTASLAALLDAGQGEQARLDALLALACTSAGDALCSRRARASALRLAPDAPAVRLALGRAAENAGDLSLALRHYRAAGESPGGEEALLYAGLLLAETRPAEARPYLERFLQRLSGHTQAGRARALLDRLP